MAETRVLIPLNQSEMSKTILPHVERHLPPGTHRLILFYVARPPKVIGLSAPEYDLGYGFGEVREISEAETHPIYSTQQEDSIRASVEAEMLPVLERLEAQGYPVSLQVNFGENVAEEILQAIQDQAVDLVAMSTRARDGLRRFFFGSIALEVLQKARVPLLLYHPH